MKVLVVGATGRIGSVLLQRAHERGHEVEGTSRRPGEMTLHRFDLGHPQEGYLPKCDVAFLLAGVAGFRQCEANADAWRINVDGVIATAKRLIRDGAFVVFTSSVAAEWAGNSQYGRAKTAVEIYLHAATDPAIVRFDLLNEHTLPPVVERLIDIGAARQPGVFYL